MCVSVCVFSGTVHGHHLMPATDPDIDANTYDVCRAMIPDAPGQEPKLVIRP